MNGKDIDCRMDQPTLALVRQCERRHPEVIMAKNRYEGSAKDKAQDKRGQRATGLSPRAYERSDRDKREDKAGQRRLNRKRK